jgi:Ca2+-binding EF-hand superfamily protein
MHAHTHTRTHAHTHTHTLQKYIDHAFGKIDTDGDGFISLEELLELIPTQPRGKTLCIMYVRHCVHV